MTDSASGIPAQSALPRRAFLKASALALGGAPLGVTFSEFLGRTASAGQVSRSPGYGELRPKKDLETGLELLKLPDGFSYRSFGWVRDAMADGRPTPPEHDGMGVVSETDGVVTLVRNHEISGEGRLILDGKTAYDRFGPAGCSTLRFDTTTGKWIDAKPSLSGTVKNCAGGSTPWGSWLSCEETVAGPGDYDDGEKLPYSKQHGWIFEVPADGVAAPEPLKAMGLFKHEALAIDPQTGIVYETEDQKSSGFYRFTPNKRETLSAGGQLEMLKVSGNGGARDLRKGLTVGDSFATEWVPIDDPLKAHDDDNKQDEHGVYMQGVRQGAATFARLEGCWAGRHSDGHTLIYFNATSGGDAKCGQVWEYDPTRERLTLLFESPGAEILESPDNLAVSPRGGIVLCEDPDHIARVHGLTPDGKLFPFAVNNIQLKGERNKITGDYRTGEWAGATFSADGKWLFMNIQKPGLTVAITGPWGEGLL